MEQAIEVLIVDDEQQSVLALIDQLQYEKIAVKHVSTCRQALEYINMETSKIKVVVLDSVLPLADPPTFIEKKAAYSKCVGIELAKHILKRHPHVKIFAFSQLAEADILSDFEENGIDYFNKVNTKNTDTLVNEIKEIIMATDNNPENKGVVKNSIFASPFKTLKAAIKMVPATKYALGVAGIAASAAIIKSFAVENNHNIPIISILLILGFMILLFIFSVMTRSKGRHLKVAGYILIYTTVFIACSSAILLASSVFFDAPKPIKNYSIFNNEDIKNQSTDLK